jgi:hypothetical protein
MTSKPKSRKISPVQPNGEPTASLGDQPRVEPETDAESKKAHRRRPRVSPPSRGGEGDAERGVLLSVEERLKKLDRLPSLETPPVLPGEQVTPANLAPRPPAPPPLPEEPKPSALIDRGATIPDNYGLDRLTAMPRDPNWVYVYWELQGGALDRLRFHHSAEIIDNARWVLRVRAGDVARASYVDIDMRVGQWYLHVSPGNVFTIDMGLINQLGKFVEVLKGVEVTTPRAGVSPVCDERWMIMREELVKLLTATGSAPDEIPALGGSERPPLPRSEQPRAIGIFSNYLREQQGPGAKGQGAEEATP